MRNLKLVDVVNRQINSDSYDGCGGRLAVDCLTPAVFFADYAGKIFRLQHLNQVSLCLFIMFFFFAVVILSLYSLFSGNFIVAGYR